MKMRTFLGLLVLNVFALPLHLRAADQAISSNSTYQLVLRPQSKVWLTGDSTLHPYGSTATAVNLNASLVENSIQSEVLSFKVTIPVEGLKSGEKGLDKNMYKALKAEAFPLIEFRLTDKRVVTTLPKEGKTKITSNGTLVISGKENPVQIDSLVEVLPEGVHIVGTKPLLMTDYGVKPPTIMAVIKVRNEVTIHFDLLLGVEGKK